MNSFEDDVRLKECHGGESPKSRIKEIFVPYLMAAHDMIGLGASSTPIMREKHKIHRNDPCPCGSGLKYKKCCINK